MCVIVWLICFLEGSVDCVARWLGNASKGRGDSWLVYWLRYRGIYFTYLGGRSSNGRRGLSVRLLLCLKCWSCFGQM